MTSIWIIAQMTFLEARRNRVIWSLVFFCIAMVLTSFLFQEVTIASFDRIVRDVAFGAINVFGVLLAVFLGVNAVTREIERRTVYALLTKPVTRAQYILGKLLGVWGTVVVCVALMLAAFLIEPRFYRGPTEGIIFEAFWLMLVELLVLVSFSVFASAFTSTVMAAFMTLSLYFIGHLSADFFFFASKSNHPWIRQIGSALFFALPNLERLNLKPQVSVLSSVPLTDIVSATAYGLLYAGAFVTLSIGLFSRRDLK